MPTDEQNTVKLTDEQKKSMNDLFSRAGNGEFHKDPANPHPHMKEAGVNQDDDGKQF